MGLSCSRHYCIVSVFVALIADLLLVASKETTEDSSEEETTIILEIVLLQHLPFVIEVDREYDCRSVSSFT